MNDNNFSSLYISFIKYYFNKICEYYQTFIQNNIGGLDILNESILKLFDKLELKDSYIIFEIIEEFIDLDDIYKKFKDMILKNYWEKVNTLIYLTNSIMKDKLSNYYNNALKDLAEAKKIANVCKELLINNFINNQSNFAKIILNDIENIVLKIEVREELIKIRKKSSIKKFFFSENIEALSILHKKYINCPFLDIDDLNELGEIIGFVKNNDLNIEKNFKKASTFIQWLEQKKSEINNNINNTNLLNIIYNILSEYPYKKESKGIEKMWDEFYDYKGKQNYLENYLNIIRYNYQTLVDNGQIDDIELNVYVSILEYINKIISYISKI